MAGSAIINNAGVIKCGRFEVPGVVAGTAILTGRQMIRALARSEACGMA